MMLNCLLGEEEEEEVKIGHVGAEKSRDTTRKWREEGGGAACDRSIIIIIITHHNKEEISSMSRLFLLILVLLDSVFSISFYLPANSRKCLQEEIRKNVLVSGEYEVSEGEDTRTDLKVRERTAGQV